MDDLGGQWTTYVGDGKRWWAMDDLGGQWTTYVGDGQGECWMTQVSERNTGY